jgi:hypothetical protein
MQKDGEDQQRTWQEHPMRRTRWAVFTSLNPREPVWRTLYDPLPAELPVQSAASEALEAPAAPLDGMAEGRDEQLR